MTDDQLILLAVLPIFRAPTEGDRGSQLEDGSAWEGSMELTRRCLLRWGIMLGGGAALIPTRRWFVVLSLTFALASLAHAAPGDPRLVQGVLEWPTKLTAEPFVVIRTEDGRWYYADIKSARRLEPAALTVGARRCARHRSGGAARGHGAPGRLGRRRRPSARAHGSHESPA